jgi:nucleoid DNA-binding protein
MNHTERIAETACRHRHLSRRLAKEAIETYLELLAQEIAEGEWVDIYPLCQNDYNNSAEKFNVECRTEKRNKKLCQAQMVSIQ